MSANGNKFLKQFGYLLAILGPVLLASVFLLSRVHAVDMKSAATDERVNGIEHRLDSIDHRLDRMDGKLDTIYKLLLERK